MSVTAHPSTSPPFAKKALTTVVEDENTRASSHTQSLPLLSPISSFTSINSIYTPSPSSSSTPFASSSASSFTSDTSSHHASRTPHTPLRSATTPKLRSSPLLRLLHPFARVLPVSNPTTPRTATMSLPPSPTLSSGPQASSRSERMLRDALIRDDMERQPTSSPLAVSQASAAAGPSSPKGHRRRHSHAPTSRFSSAVPSSSPEREEYTRGTFLFRTALSNPRSPSPSPREPSVYGGDAELTPTTPVRRHSLHQHHPHAQSPRPALAPRSHSNSPSGGSLRSTSHSPSPLRRRRPSPLALDRTPTHSPGGVRGPAGGAVERISESPGRRPRSRQGRVAPGEPLVMTPHEQVLRARLERVLSAGRGVEQGEQERQRARRAHQRSMSRENEVRDEDGGWPWREQVEPGGNAGVSAAGPLNSATSNNSGTSSGQSQTQPERSMNIPTARIPSTVRAVSHRRTRSKTDPMPPPLPSSLGPGRSSAAPSPRRSSTEPSRIPKRKQSTPPSPLISRTGTTPPLDPGEDAEGDDGDDGDMRLLTPPPTPPFTNRAFTLSGAPASGTDGYCPSPYRTAYSPMKPLAPRTTPKDSLGFGAPRRPRHAPLHRPVSSSSDHEHEQDSSSCSSGNSQASFPASNTSSAYAVRRRRSRSADVQDDIDNALSSSISRHRPQFNARKASARCRAIEGYVSFASVEGLGEPPADPMSPDGASLEHERGRSSGVLGAAWGGWKKLLNVAGLEGHAVKDGGVVL